MKTTKIVEGADFDTEVSYDDDGINIVRGDVEIEAMSNDEALQLIEALQHIVKERDDKAAKG